MIVAVTPLSVSIARPTAALAGAKCRLSLSRSHPFNPDRRCRFVDRHRFSFCSYDRRPKGGDCSSKSDDCSSNRRCRNTTSDTFPRNRHPMNCHSHTTSSYSHRNDDLGRRSLPRESDAPKSYVHGLLLDEERHDLALVPLARFGDATEAKRRVRSDREVRNHGLRLQSRRMVVQSSPSALPPQRDPRRAMTFAVRSTLPEPRRASGGATGDCFLRTVGSTVDDAAWAGLLVGLCMSARCARSAGSPCRRCGPPPRPACAPSGRLRRGERRAGGLHVRHDRRGVRKVGVVGQAAGEGLGELQ